MTLFCPFCAIIERKLPALIVYEDDQTIAFLPLQLDAYGHTLVIPKTHCTDLFDMPPEDAHAVMDSAKKVAKLLKERLGATGVNLLNASGKDAQQTVFHFHLHLIPRFPDDGVDAEMRVKVDSTQKREEIHRRLLRTE